MLLLARALRLSRLRLLRAHLAVLWWSSFACLGLAACRNDVECVARVTDGSRTFEGTASGPVKEPRDRGGLEREAFRAACRAMCTEGEKACVARCVTDVSAAKIGGQVSCK